MPRQRNKNIAAKGVPGYGENNSAIQPGKCLAARQRKSPAATTSAKATRKPDDDVAFIPIMPHDIEDKGTPRKIVLNFIISYFWNQ